MKIFFLWELPNKHTQKKKEAKRRRQKKKKKKNTENKELWALPGPSHQRVQLERSCVANSIGSLGVNGRVSLC